jgi:transmembrane sensor
MEMEQLIIRFLQGSATPADVRRLQEWRKASSENERQFEEVALIWDKLRQADVATVPPPSRAIVELSDRIAKIGVADAPRKAHLLWSAGIAAAAVVLALGAGEFLTRGSTPVALALRELTVTTGPGEATTTILSDGTVVHLDAESRLEVRPASDHREVWLRGRAFFGVAELDGVPFVVRSDVGSAEVLGTRFEFSTRRDAARVVVVDGRVVFERGRERVELQEKQMVETTDGEDILITAVGDIDSALRWMGQSLVFHDTPLVEAAREIEQRYGATVIIDESLASETITGGFGERGFASVVAAICSVVGAECVIGDLRAVISARGPAEQDTLSRS